MRNKHNYYTIDYTISPQENLKKLVNQNFQKEISLDILRNMPPDYSDLKINKIEFQFYDQKVGGCYRAEDSNKIHSLRLNVLLRKGRKAKYGSFKNIYKKKSIRIINDTEIDINYLKKIFYEFKDLKEKDEAEYLKNETAGKERETLITEIRNKYNITYPAVYVYISDDTPATFRLSFNKLTEDQVKILMACYWQQINKKNNNN